MSTSTDRTWRLQAFTDHGQQPRIEFLRERLTEYEDGNKIHGQLPTVTRSLAEVIDRPISGGPFEITTMGDLFAAVAACGHQLAAEDEKIAAAIAAAEAQRIADAAAAAEEAQRRANLTADAEAAPKE